MTHCPKVGQATGRNLVRLMSVIAPCYPSRLLGQLSASLCIASLRHSTLLQMETMSATLQQCFLSYTHLWQVQSRRAVVWNATVGVMHCAHFHTQALMLLGLRICGPKCCQLLILPGVQGTPLQVLRQPVCPRHPLLQRPLNPPRPLPDLRCFGGLRSRLCSTQNCSAPQKPVKRSCNSAC